MNTAFLERMNSLLASGEIPGLYEGDEFVTLMNDCKTWATRNNVVYDTTDELFRHFTKNVQNNLHVVFTMNPASSDFDNRAATSPALFNRCVVDWFGDWSRTTLSQVGKYFTNKIDVDMGSASGSGSGSASDQNNGYTPAPSSWERVQRLSLGILDGDEYSHLIPSALPSLHQAVIATLVFIHENVKMKGVSKTGSASITKYVSPRDYIDFIKHFIDLYNEKRSQLEEQQLHLNIGLDKLKETGIQVKELQKGLSSKEKLLKTKNIQANDKLQQMVLEQNQAERSKKEATILKKELDVRNKEVEVQRIRAEEDLSKAEPALKEAQEAVSGIQKKHLDEIRSLSRPPAAIRLTMEAVVMMLNPERIKDHAWRTVRSDMKKSHFVQEVIDFQSDSISSDVRKLIKKKYLGDVENFNLEKVQKASKCTGPLYKWIASNIEFADIKERIEPLRLQVETLAKESEELVVKHEKVENEIILLEESINNYKIEYAELIKETEKIKSEMNVVSSKCSRATTLLSSLDQEKSRWESGSETFQEQLNTLLGDVLLAGGFVSYIGFFDHRARVLLLQTWRSFLFNINVEYKSDLSLVNYLSTPSERIEWSSNELPDDVLCVENAIILNKFNRYPLIIDPSGQAMVYLQKQHASKRMNLTSFLDISFMKHLESALRFGTCLLVQDVEEIDPVLNPVLNREFQKTGGRVLIRLGAADIDFSPSFSMYMTTRDPLFQFTPDICSRVTFVNFTITPASLTSQCLSKILKSERPEIDIKRCELLKLQGEYQAKLRELEDSLLEAINSVQGNILDDDKVILTLEVLKKDAADVTLKQSKSLLVLDEVEETSNAYLPLAIQCSQIYFTIERLGSISFLYQFALSFFLNILDDVLLVSNQNSGEEKRIELLSSSIFHSSFTRTARGLLYDDKLLFALSLTQIKTTPDDQMLQFLLYGEMSKEELSSQTIQDAKELCRQICGQDENENGGEESASTSYVTLSTTQELQFASLLSKYSKLSLHVSDHMKEWKVFMRSSKAEEMVPPGNYYIKDGGGENDGGEDSGLIQSTFFNMILIKILRPDRLTMSCTLWINSVFSNSNGDGDGGGGGGGGDAVKDTLKTNSTINLTSSGLEFNLKDIIEQESSCHSPIMLCSRNGFDASSKIDQIAKDKKDGTFKYQSLAMGSEEGYQLAEKYITSASKKGTWVLLRNVHLCPSYMIQLEKKLHSLKSNSNFRLFLTAEINNNIPTSLLRISQTFVYEPPAGIKASLSRSMSTITDERMNAAPAERSRLYFLLTWFHATVIERLQYVPVGWSKSYEFSETDLNCAFSSFDGWIDSISKGRSHIDPNEIPWDALHAMLGQSLYGGRIDNEFDQRLLNSFITKFFCANSFSSTFELAKNLIGPEGTKKINFIKWIDRLPNKNSPSWLGLPETAEDMLLANVGMNTLRKFVMMQDLKDDESSSQSNGNKDEESDDSDDEENSRRNRSRSSGSSPPSSPRIKRRSSVSTSKEGSIVIPPWIIKLNSLATSWLHTLPTEISFNGDVADKKGKKEKKEQKKENVQTPETPLGRFFKRERNVGMKLLTIIRDDLER